MKNPPTRPLVNRDSATGRARRLDVQFDVGELSFDLRSVRSREADPALKIVGLIGAMVGVSSSFREADPVSIFMARLVPWLARTSSYIGGVCAEIRCEVSEPLSRRISPVANFPQLGVNEGFSFGGFVQ